MFMFNAGTKITQVELLQTSNSSNLINQPISRSTINRLFKLFSCHTDPHSRNTGNTGIQVIIHSKLTVTLKPTAKASWVKKVKSVGEGQKVAIF